MSESISQSFSSENRNWVNESPKRQNKHWNDIFFCLNITFSCQRVHHFKVQRELKCLKVCWSKRPSAFKPTAAQPESLSGADMWHRSSTTRTAALVKATADVSLINSIGFSRRTRTRKLLLSRWGAALPELWVKTQQEHRVVCEAPLSCFSVSCYLCSAAGGMRGLLLVFLKKHDERLVWFKTQAKILTFNRTEVTTRETFFKYSVKTNDRFLTQPGDLHWEIMKLMTFWSDHNNNIKITRCHAQTMYSD